MFDGLLQTKLFIPSSRAALVPRPQLIERLNEGQTGKLTLVSAPAGYGKTTLICEWIAESKRPFAWLSLDSNDRDPERFFAYLIAAIQTIQDDFGQELLDFLETAQPSSVEQVATRLINECSTISEPIVLVLDDYHVLDSKPVDDILVFLLIHLPAHIHLVITTREDPSFSLSRMRVRGELTELRIADLRFSEEEATQFLNQGMDLNLTTSEIGQLELRTEGWAAGLQMAALSMRGRSDTKAFVEAFTGSHRFVLDYLAEEVLDAQTEQVRLFLLKTAILKRLSAPLCDAVTGQQHSREMLKQLEHSNMLIIPLDDQRQWYRYHHLFADVLQAHARLELSDQFPDLHIRASHWYERQGLWSEAIDHALSSKNLERTADLVERAWPIIPKGIKPSGWLSWAKEIPLQDVRRRPVLSAAYGWVSLDMGDLQAAEMHLRNVEGWLATPSEAQAAQMIVANEAQFPTLSATTACARAYLAQANGDPLGVIHHAQRALDLLAAHEHYWRGTAALMLGMAQWSDGNLAAAIESITASLVSQRKANNLYFQIFGAVILAEIQGARGNLREALAHYEEALVLAQSNSRQNSQVGQVTINLYAGLGDLYREWGDLETAVQYLSKGQSIIEQVIIPTSEYRLHKVMAQIKEAEGDFAGALTLLDVAERLQQPAAFPDLRPIPAIRAKLWVRQGRVAEAIKWANSVSDAVSAESTYRREFELMTYARAKLAQYAETKEESKLLEAKRILQPLLQKAESADRIGSVIELSILLASALEVSGEMAQAVELIQNALTLAEPAGYFRIFADEGQAIRPFLVAALTQKDTKPAYISRLIEAIDQPFNHDNDEILADPNQLLIEPLSKRELEVLHMLARGQTNQSIADDLVIALSTVKKHVNNIFGKLNVSSRTQAVNRARDLNLVC
ncbi:MAG: LuxR C-terminal-related transcriptional regulator [Chloroflexota bacterium]